MSVIARLWKRQPGKLFCLSTKGDRWRDHFFERSDLGDLDEFMADHRLDNIYWCPHPFTAPRRIKANAVLPKLLWADLDAVDPRLCKPRPTIAIASSPGRYVGLWLTDRAVTEQLNKRLTYALGADRGGWDLSQVLRAPGTWNYKYDPPARVRLMWEDGPRYTVAGLERMLPKLAERNSPQPIVQTDGRDWRDICRERGALSVVSMVKARSLAGVNRSRLIAAIAVKLFEKGATVGEVSVVIAASTAFAAKFGGTTRTAEDEAVGLHRWWSEQQ